MYILKRDRYKHVLLYLSFLTQQDITFKILKGAGNNLSFCIIK